MKQELTQEMLDKAVDSGGGVKREYWKDVKDALKQNKIYGRYPKTITELSETEGMKYVGHWLTGIANAKRQKHYIETIREVLGV